MIAFILLDTEMETESNWFNTPKLNINEDFYWTSENERTLAFEIKIEIECVLK